MSFALYDPISYPLIVVVIGWGTLVMSRAKPMSFIALAFAALAVASALYLILDLSSPYSGLFRASSAPLEQVLAYMGQGQGAVGGQR